jgi:hypothetical protein
MSDHILTDVETVIVEVLNERGADDESKSIKPKTLLALCAAKGQTDSRRVEMAVMNLIDHDVIEYDMDDDNRVSGIWLLNEEL